MPKEIEQLSSIRRFIIPNMAVEGPILDYMKTMENLEYIALPAGSFTGTIPEAFADEHPLLNFIDLGGNLFTGAIPTSIGKLQYLVQLKLRTNGFSGSIPSELALIPALRKYRHFERFAYTFDMQYIFPTFSFNFCCCAMLNKCRIY